MTKIYKLSETNPKKLEQYIKDLHRKEKQKKRENRLLFFLCMLGLLGLYFLYNFSKPITPNYSDYNIQWKDISAASINTGARVHQVNYFSSNSSQYDDKNVIPSLKIMGEQEAHLPITFQLDSFDAAARYTLDLGNGQTKVLSSKQCSFTYRKPGQYPIKLKVQYKGQSRNIYSGLLQIKSTIEIAEGAEIEI